MYLQRKCNVWNKQMMLNINAELLDVIMIMSSTQDVSGVHIILFERKVQYNKKLNRLSLLFFRHEIETHPGLQIEDANPSDIMDTEGYYQCRGGCGLVYKTKVTRNR